MSTSIITMADYVSYVDQERQSQWGALGAIRGHSFPDCMENNGKKKGYKPMDAYGKPFQKNEKDIEILSANIGNKASFNACLKKHGIHTPLTQLTGVGKNAIQWFYDYQVEKYEVNGIKLDEGAHTFLNDCSFYFTPRRIMWNKHESYIKGDKTAFAGDSDIPKYMLAIVLENEIQDSAIHAGVGAARKYHEIFLKKYIEKITDPDLAQAMLEELEKIQKKLNEDIPVSLGQELSTWSEKYLLPEIMNIRRLRSGSEE